MKHTYRRTNTDTLELRINFMLSNVKKTHTSPAVTKITEYYTDEHELVPPLFRTNNIASEQDV